MQEFQMLNEADLAEVNGGFWPLIVCIWLDS
ncbi:MAG: class IIb bacteriocin, lactobin A/cerein 7B family [Leuconostoc gelidum]|nr:class IIb bacteriocin, lactobin A/cerein 7B family [Leuconostoc gelidum]MBZ5979487.1 class IIb bacteriocin, lactobin A/cerein 7B family [Leuconostoc gelidum subsp. gelidum]MBZ6002372.1 class IIb bacteriocin, lactobin A/cerein 7B family [Leuconostoc gelidum subsp. gelidum]